MSSDTGLSRRHLLRGAALGAAGLAAAGLAACTSSPTAPGSSSDGTSPGLPTHGLGASASTGTVDHDALAAASVKRFVEGEWQKVTPYGGQPLAPRVDGDTKVFDMTGIVHLTQGG